MNAHRYQVGDTVEHGTIVVGGPNQIVHWWMVEILEQTPTPTVPIWNNAPHYIVRRVGGQRRFLTDETYLRPKAGMVYPLDEFTRRCRAIEPVEIIEGCVQPLSPWTTARVHADMAREQATKRREAALNHRRLFSFIDHRFGIVH